MITTQADYLESLRRLKKRVFMFGEELENYVDHPMLRPSLNAVAMTYQLADDTIHKELMTAELAERFAAKERQIAGLMDEIKNLLKETP